MNKTRKYKPGGQPYCTECNKFHVRKRMTDNPEAYRQYARTSSLRQRYGMSQEQYDLMLFLQDGYCALCGTEEWGARRPHVDHDHRTGKIRGILCHKCNTALGLFEDNEEILQLAIKYLRSHKE